ncbi:IS3 family transposase [Pseudotabrizicola sediminis]|nr:IS3 family transposase [Pseudotabrizicola sediminis]
MIERTHPKLSVGAQCQLLSISRSSFYYTPQGETAMNLDLMLKVDKQFLDTPFYGVRQMTWHLQNEGHAVNEKRIRRLMRLMRLMPIYQKPNTSKPAKGHKGVVRGKLLAAGQGGSLACRHDQTLPIPLLQDESRDHPPGGDALHPVSAVAPQRRGSAARAGDRDQP